MEEREEEKEIRRDLLPFDISRKILLGNNIVRRNPERKKGERGRKKELRTTTGEGGLYPQQAGVQDAGKLLLRNFGERWASNEGTQRPAVLRN